MKALDRPNPGLFHGCNVRVRLCMCNVLAHVGPRSLYV